MKRPQAVGPKNLKKKGPARGIPRGRAFRGRGEIKINEHKNRGEESGMGGPGRKCLSVPGWGEKGRKGGE